MSTLLGWYGSFAFCHCIPHFSPDLRKGKDDVGGSTSGCSHSSRIIQPFLPAQGLLIFLLGLVVEPFLLSFCPEPRLYPLSPTRTNPLPPCDSPLSHFSLGLGLTWLGWLSPSCLWPGGPTQQPCSLPVALASI